MYTKFGVKRIIFRGVMEVAIMPPSPGEPSKGPAFIGLS